MRIAGKYAFLVLSVLVPLAEEMAQDLEVVVQQGHSKTIRSISFSPDGNFVVTGSADHTARIWDTRTGKEIRTFKHHLEDVPSAVYAPDGHTILSVDHGLTYNQVFLWEAETGKIVRRYRITGALTDFYSERGRVSPDGTSILLCSQTQGARLYDLLSGEERRRFGPNRVSVGFYDCVFLGGGKSVAAVTTDGKIEIWSQTSGAPEASFERKKARSVRELPNGRLLVMSDTQVEAWDWRKKQVEFSLTDEKEVVCMDVTHDGLLLATGRRYFSNTRKRHCYEVKVWDLSSGAGRVVDADTFNVADVAFSPDGTMLGVVGGGFTGGFQENDRFAHLVDVHSGKRVRSLTGMVPAVKSATFTSDHEVLAGTAERAHVWDLMLGRKIRSLPQHGPAFCEGSVSLIVDGRNAGLWNFRTGQRIKTLTGASEGTEAGVALGQFYPGTGQVVVKNWWTAPYALWDTSSTGGKIRDLPIPADDSYRFRVSPDAKSIAVIQSGEVAVFDPRSGGEKYRLGPHVYDLTSVTFSLDNRLALTTDFAYGHVWDMQDGSEVGILGYHNHEFEGGPCDSTCRGHRRHFLCSAFGPQNRTALTGGNDNRVILWDLGSPVQRFDMWTNRKLRFSGQPRWTFDGCSNAITAVEFDKDGKRVLVGSEDGTVRLLDAISGAEIVTLLAIGPGDYCIVTPDGYYTASRGISRHIHFVKGLKTFYFENFDLIFNRPDVIFQRLGLADQKLIQAVKQAYLRRLRRFGFEEGQVTPDMHLPELVMVNADVPARTGHKQITLQVRTSDSKYRLDRINVFVNDVPLYGVSGISLRDRVTRETVQTVDVVLNAGRNKIQLSSHNERGVESVKETLEVFREGEPEKPTLWIVAIGVSEYRMSQFNLKYASKDANDILSRFAEAQTFSKVQSVRLVDQEVTRANILKVKEFLMQSGVDDQVILFVAGHGLLNEKLDWYFATHDVDFERPSDRGVSYDELEGLLDGIPARKKLLLMDACHSGEVDKEESVRLSSAGSGGSSNVTSRAFKTKVVKKSGLGLENSFELMQELFANLQRGSGAQVIASASGAEYAFESAEWNNGVFTYALLEGLKSRSADANKDGQIVVSELRDYVTDKVRDLTQGKQNPTSRRENIEFDFTVW